MSNKTLLVAILLVLIAGVAAAGYYYWQNTKPLVVTPSKNSDSQTQPIPPPDISMGEQPCKRDFDPNKLTKDKVDIKNRVVEIQVKGYGSIQLAFYDQDAPKTVENFLRLTDAGYYDCLTFHRVAKDFVIQGGDPNGNGSGGESAFGKPFADELNPATPSYKAGYKKGVLAMANSGPNTNGSQFFIMLADNQLPNNYTIFGHVIAGQDVVDKIGQVAITPQMGPTDGAPVTPVVMESVKIVK